MKLSTKKNLTLTVAWAAFLMMLSVVFGVDKGWSDIKALWWTVPCLMVWAGGLWKAGWIRVR